MKQNNLSSKIIINSNNISNINNQNINKMNLNKPQNKSIQQRILPKMNIYKSKFQLEKIPIKVIETPCIKTDSVYPDNNPIYLKRKRMLNYLHDDVFNLYNNNNNFNNIENKNKNENENKESDVKFVPCRANVYQSIPLLYEVKESTQDGLQPFNDPVFFNLTNKRVCLDKDNENLSNMSDSDSEGNSSDFELCEGVNIEQLSEQSNNIVLYILLFQKENTENSENIEIENTENIENIENKENSENIEIKGKKENKKSKDDEYKLTEEELNFFKELRSKITFNEWTEFIKIFRELKEYVYYYYLEYYNMGI